MNKIPAAARLKSEAMKAPHPENPSFESDTTDPATADLERLIVALPVRQPGVALDGRVAAALDGAGVVAYGSTGYLLPWVRRLTAAAAVLVIGGGVAIVAMSVFDDPDAPLGDRNSVAPGGVTAEPTTPITLALADDAALFEDVWVASEPTGRVFMAGDRAMELVRVSTIRHTSFEEDGVSYAVSLPDEQIIIVPASYE